MSEVIFEVPGNKITARQAAQEFADTFDPPRAVVWHVDGKFHFEGGYKTYEALPMPHGWKIAVISADRWKQA